MNGAARLEGVGRGFRVVRRGVVGVNVVDAEFAREIVALRGMDKRVVRPAAGVRERPPGRG